MQFIHVLCIFIHTLPYILHTMCIFIHQKCLFIGRKKFLVGAAMRDAPPHPFHTTAGGTGGDIVLYRIHQSECVKVPTYILFLFFCLLNLAGVYNVHRLYTLQSLDSSCCAASSTIPIMSIKGIVLNNMQQCVCLCVVLKIVYNLLFCIQLLHSASSFRIFFHSSS